MRLSLAVITACFVAMAARVLAVRSALPTRLATHYGPSGAPDAFGPPDAFFVLYALLAAFTIGCLLLTPLFLRVLPSELLNLPNRAYWLVPERRPQAIATLTRWSGRYAAWLALFLSAVLELVLRANLAGGPLDSRAFGTLLVVFFAGSALGLVHLVRAFRVG